MVYGDARGENIDCLAWFCTWGSASIINERWIREMPSSCQRTLSLAVCYVPVATPALLSSVASSLPMFQSAPPFRDLYKLPFHVLCLLTRCLLRVTRSQVQAFSPKPLLLLGKGVERPKTPPKKHKEMTHEQEIVSQSTTHLHNHCWISCSYQYMINFLNLWSDTKRNTQQFRFIPSPSSLSSQLTITT